MTDSTVTISRKQADDAINAERVLRTILTDESLDVTVNVGGYLVMHGEPSFPFMDPETVIIDLTPEQLVLCQRLQGGDDG